MDDGQPLPPLIEDGVAWHVASRADGRRLWRRLSLTSLGTDWRAAPGDSTRVKKDTTMDMTKYSGQNFIKVDDVRDGPIEGQIAGIKEGKFGKPDLFLDSGDVLSLNATNNKTLMRAYGKDSDLWLAKTIRLFLGEIEYQGSPHEAVVVEPISPPIKKTKETKKAKEADGKPWDDGIDDDFGPKPKGDMSDDEIPY